ncbi:hypothetical protein [Hymenobacter glacieicola]|uniref:Dienelactone hydrolase domain-containing protein n=1 Tax=Hymenobacter glacieicola TaxID=1562124 RepID=A0ABQ1WH31_9BACT|nr:hypothetical protein [Hymenobacter glacieicola]GGG29254.1 hypothetical protein GCM10011378_02410 [Hymenobacter glacieicola]
MWGLPVLLAACSNDAGGGQQAQVPLPTGHYEGPVSYQGSELRVSLDLREVSPGKLQADVSFPQLPGLEFEADRLTYQEPQLRLEQQAGQAGGISIQAIREGDFLRGLLSFDSVRADFVWVRRGEAGPRGFREQGLTVRYAGRVQAARLLLPDDTLRLHPAVALLTVPQTQAAAQARAAYLARRGFVTMVVTTPSPTATPDSSAYYATAAALTTLRRQAAVDSGRVGCWARGSVVPQVAGAAARARPAAAFVVLESVAAASRDEASQYQPLSQQRIPVLALYAGLDTSLNVRESTRRLRSVLGNRRGTQIRTYPQATADFVQPGKLGADGQWQWPKPAPGYWDGLTEWLRKVTN